MSNSVNSDERSPTEIGTTIDFQRIRTAAKESGLSTRAIAEKAGDITHSTVAKVLNGDTNPSAINVKKICDAVGLPIEKIFLRGNDD